MKVAVIGCGAIANDLTEVLTGCQHLWTLLLLACEAIVPVADVAGTVVLSTLSKS